MAITFVGQVAASVFAPSATKAYVSTAGNALILSLQHQSFSPPTVTDTAGNTWLQGPDTVVDGTGAPAEKQVGLWYVINALPITSLTVTTSGAGSKAILFNLSEWRGVDSLRAKSSTYAVTPSTNSAAASVTAQTGDLVIGNMGYYDATGRDDTLVSGYTALTGNTITTTFQSAGYQIVTTTASAGPTYTYTRNTQSGIAVASFIPATVRTIGIAATATYNPTGLQNPSTTGAVIPIPSGGVIGQYVIAAVFFGQGTGPASIVTPTNWTVLTPAGLTGTSANRVTILYGYKISDATALSNLGSSFLAKVGYSSTRIVAVTHLMNNVDLNATPSIGLIEFSASAVSSITFNSPAAGDYMLYFPATNSSAPTPNSVMTSTGGTKNVQVQSLDVASGSSADSQIASMTGGTGATLSISVPNHVSFGVGFMAAYVPVVNTTLIASFTHTESGVMTSVTSTSTDSNGTITSYDWDWGDGSTHATSAAASHTYSVGGTYSVVLKVTDNSATTAMKTTAITVTSSWIKRTLVQAPENGTTSHTVSFTAATAGNLLVAIAEGGVTSTTPTGWTLPANGSAVNYSGLYVWYKTATANESSFSTTHNSSNYAMVYDIFEFPSNYLFVISNDGAGLAASSSNPTITSLTGITSVFGVAGVDISLGSGITGVSISWTASPQNPTALTNIFVSPNVNDGYAYGLSYIDSYSSASYQPNHIVTYTGGTNIVEALTFAVHANLLPVAVFTHSEGGLVTTVNGATSTDADGTVVGYDWNWGDGTTHGTGSTTTHTYATAGSYSVTLIVTDNSGGTGTSSQTVTIGTTTPPTRKGYSFLNPGVANTSLVLDPATITSGTGISDNDWMVATIVTSSTTTSVSAPAGWTTLLALTSIGTLRYAVYGKIRVNGETNYTYTLDAGGTTSAGTLMWGGGADKTVTNWLVGANTNRSVDLHNTGASITTTVDHSLILGISAERTTANESGITSVAGATAWYFMPQSGSQIETIDIAYVADKTPAGATTTIDWTYPNTQTVNGMAMQLAIPPGASSGGTTISIGYPGVLRVGTTNYSGKMYYWDGSAAHDFSATPIVEFKPATVTQFLSASHSPWLGAHRGFSYSYPEETIYAYRSATDWGIHAIEISVQVSQDGTFWCFHDTTTTRTTGVSGTISSMTDVTLAALSNLGSTATANTSQPARPTAKLTDILNIYAATHVIIIEDKTYTHTTTLLNLMDSYGTSGRLASEIFIWKVDALSGAGFYTAASSRGYHRWGYIFDASMSSSYASVISSGKMDMIGLDYNSSDSTLSAAVASAIANGVRPTGHIISSTTQRDRMLGLGMTGLMISNKDIVPPWYTSWGGV